MPINFPMFQGGQVPLPRPIQPLQQPQHYDPAQIIMQAAALRQQKDIAQQQLQQQQTQHLSELLNTAATLSEHKREAQAQEAHAGALLELQQQMQGPKMEEAKASIMKMQAEAQKAQSEADLNKIFTNAGAVHPSKTYGPGEKADPNNPPDNLPTMMWDYMTKAHQLQASYGALRYTRGPLGQAAPFMQMLHTKYFPYDDMNAIEGTAKGVAAQKVATGTLEGGVVEKAVRAEGNIQATLNNLKTIVPRLNSTQFSLINRMQLGIEQDTGDRDVNLLNSFIIDAAKEMPQLFPGNTGSDKQAQLSLSSLNQTKSPQQLMDSINQLQLTAHDRSRAWQKLPTSSDIIRNTNGNRTRALQNLQDAGYQF